jgi:hypothetical protein
MVGGEPDLGTAHYVDVHTPAKLVTAVAFDCLNRLCSAPAAPPEIANTLMK